MKLRALLLIILTLFGSQMTMSAQAIKFTAQDFEKLIGLRNAYQVTDFANAPLLRLQVADTKAFLEAIQAANAGNKELESKFNSHPDIRELLVNQRKAEALLELDTEISKNNGKCSGTDRDLLNRIQAAAQAQDSCAAYSNTPTSKLARSLAQVLKHSGSGFGEDKKAREALRLTKAEAIQTTVETYLMLDWQTGGRPPSDEDIVKLCKDVPELCRDPKRLESLKRLATRLGEGLRGKTKPSLVLAAGQMSRGLEKLNQTLLKIEVDKTKGWVWDSPNITDETREALALYRSQYNDLSSVGLGTLMRTQKMRTVVGDPRLETDAKKNESGKFIFPPHRTGVKASDLGAAAVEAQESMLARLRKLVTPSPRENVAADLEELVRTSPVAVGRMLLQNPRLFSEVCSIIARIQSTDEDDAFADNLSWGGGIVSAGTGLLAITAAGVAYIAAAPIAVPASIGAVALGAVSTVTGLAVTGYEIAEGYEAYGESKVLAESLASGTGDQRSLDESRKTVDEYQEAVRNAVMSGVLSIAGAGAIKGGILLAQAGGRALQMRKVTALLKNATVLSKADKQVGKTLDEVARWLKGPEYSRFLGYLSKVDADTQTKFLKNLSKMSKKDRDDAIKALMCMS